MEVPTVFTLIFVVCVVYGKSILDDDWSAFKLRHNKQYNRTEDIIRRLIWEENKREVDRHNAEADKGIYSYYLGINSYSDMKSTEFVKTMNGLKVSKDRIKGKTFVPTVDPKRIPDTLNWTALGYVTEVGNQGQCGSCWAFSLLGALEGQWYRNTRNLVRLSVQDLIDCTRSIGNQGCCGGFMDKTYQFLSEKEGVNTWASYPYEAKDGKCRFKNDSMVETDTGFVDILKGNEYDLQVAVATMGPVAVAMDASHTSFQQYKSGVYDEPNCSSTQVDHTLLVVGYGTYKGKDYWLAKNSWGTSWGMDGYIMMTRFKNNQCGIATMASYPTVAINHHIK